MLLMHFHIVRMLTTVYCVWQRMLKEAATPLKHITPTHSPTQSPTTKPISGHELSQTPVPAAYAAAKLVFVWLLGLYTAAAACGLNLN